uniref:Uncharacterized protein n=1 Tax=Amorphochlora amoebiformis TaxID=1561963 RepID=A0A7S0H6D1_9EUKA
MKASEEIQKVIDRYAKKKKKFIFARAGAIRRIPDFWKMIFEYHPILQTRLEEIDRQILGDLKYIFAQDIETDTGSGYEIRFEFGKGSRYIKENEFIRKVILTEQDSESISIVTNTPIHWKSSKIAKKNPNSMFVLLFTSNQAENDVVEIIREDLLENPVQAYASAVEAESELQLEMDAIPDLVTTYQ